MSELYSEVIHDWLKERFPCPDKGAYLNFDNTITIIAEPNMKVYYREEVVHICCWISYCGVGPAEFRISYSDPEMFSRIDRAIQLCQEMEREAIQSGGEVSFWQLCHSDITRTDQ